MKERSKEDSGSPVNNSYQLAHTNDMDVHGVQTSRPGKFFRGAKETDACGAQFSSAGCDLIYYYSSTGTGEQWYIEFCTINMSCHGQHPSLRLWINTASLPQHTILPNANTHQAAFPTSELM